MIGEKCDSCGESVLILKNFNGKRFCLDCFDKIKKGKIQPSQELQAEDYNIDKINAVIDGDIPRYNQNMTYPSYSANGVQHHCNTTVTSCPAALRYSNNGSR